MVIFVGQRDQVWYVVCAEEDGQYKPGTSTNENLIEVVGERCQNFAYASDPYIA